MAEKIEFLASFPPIQSAIKITGNGDGMRIQLDIPETEMGQAALLLLMRETRLKVTIEPIPKNDQNGRDSAPSRRTAKRRD